MTEIVQDEHGSPGSKYHHRVVVTAFRDHFRRQSRLDLRRGEEAVSCQMQVAAPSRMIAEGRLDALIFFIDPLSALPHDVDVKSLLRLAVHYNTALALNEQSADAILDWLSKDNGG